LPESCIQDGLEGNLSILFLSNRLKAASKMGWKTVNILNVNNSLKAASKMGWKAIYVLYST
jgi:hypothetical protein